MIIRSIGIMSCDGAEVELSIPPHPELDVYPAWLGERMQESAHDVRDGPPDSSAYASSRLVKALGEQEWLDHWGTAVYAGKEYLISEPYDMNREKVGQLVGFCDSLGLAFSIQASGHWYPTKTMRILIWPKDWPRTDELLFEAAAYEVRAREELTRACEARAATAEREIAFRLGQRPEGTESDSRGAFALEAHLRDYLVRNLEVLEDGMTLWPEGRAVEFPTKDGRRTDILARDSNGIPTVIETKVGKGHERTVGQVANYRAMVKRSLSTKRVRILIVAREASPELLRAASELQDCTILEYQLTVDFREPTERPRRRRSRERR